MELLPDKFDTNYRSVILFGKAAEVNNQEKDEVLLEFIKKYSKEFIEKGKNCLEKAKGATRVFKINIEHITGKAQK